MSFQPNVLRHSSSSFNLEIPVLQFLEIVLNSIVLPAFVFCPLSGTPNVCMLDPQDCQFFLVFFFFTSSFPLITTSSYFCSAFLGFSHLLNVLLFSISAIIFLISKNTFLFSKCSFLFKNLFTASCPYFPDIICFISASLDLLSLLPFVHLLSTFHGFYCCLLLFSLT